jgi:hypothetical protein
MATFTILLLGITALLSAIIVLTVVVLRQRATQRDAKFRLRWRPRLASGPNLMLWSATLSEVVTRRILALRRTKRTAATLAREILGLASFAIQHHLPCVDKGIEFTDCRDRVPSRIGVTPPEILAIADEIRRDATVARQIHNRAKRNALLLARDSADEKLKSLECPLRNREGACVAGRFCPLPCRTTCQLASELQPQDAAVLQGVARDIRLVLRSVCCEA